MPVLRENGSDVQPGANSISRCRRLIAIETVRGGHFDQQPTSRDQSLGGQQIRKSINLLHCL